MKSTIHEYLAEWAMRKIFKNNGFIRLVSLCKKCPYLELFWSVFFRIQSERGKMPTRTIPNTDTFHVVYMFVFSPKMEYADLINPDLKQRQWRRSMLTLNKFHTLFRCFYC